MHGRHKTGRTRKGVQKLQGPNQNGHRPYGPRAQHVRERDCRHPRTQPKLSSELATPLRRRRPRTPALSVAITYVEMDDGFAIRLKNAGRICSRSCVVVAWSRPATGLMHAMVVMRRKIHQRMVTRKESYVRCMPAHVGQTGTELVRKTVRSVLDFLTCHS